MEEKKTYKTTYKVAAEWLNNSLIQLYPDEGRLANLWENRRWDWDGDDEVFEWFLTDCSEGDVEFLEKYFGLKFSFDDELGRFVLAVDHLGTGWDYVAMDTDLEAAACDVGEEPYDRQKVWRSEYDEDLRKLKEGMECLLKASSDENGRLVAENETLRSRLSEAVAMLVMNGIDPDAPCGSETEARLADRPVKATDENKEGE